MLTTLRLFSVLTKWASGIEGSRSKFIGAMTAGLIAGFGNIAMIAVINTILTKGVSKPMVWYFAGLCVLVPLSGFISQTLLIRLTAQATRNLRIRLSQQIIAAPESMKARCCRTGYSHYDPKRSCPENTSNGFRPARIKGAGSAFLNRTT